MRKSIILIILCLLSIVFGGELTKANGQTFAKANENKDSFDLKAYGITDYLYLFQLDKDVGAFVDINGKDYHEERWKAHMAQTYMILTLDEQYGFFAFRTLNTPPDWDGDSKAELEYTMTYWNLGDSTRFIALSTTESTWVNNETIAVSFYRHDKTGVHSIDWDTWTWNLGDFIGAEYESDFDPEIWANPLVVVRLPQKGKEILVELAFHEYMDNQEAYDTFEALDIGEPTKLQFNPIEDYSY